ncbi:hypothetical protein Bca52824_001598 [Brassica carinata]|uniref:Auxin response factor domain-containing protein n=1 Tax=Brassica carinata TaxID=52824 RepID=A0A8X7WLU9_BRACI|nr:hypothetical protein Bca52824_001598 [Brassica carinata]
MATIDGTNNYLNDQLWKLCVGPLFDTPKVGEKDVEIPIPKNEDNIRNINYFTKVLSASDARKNGAFVLFKRHAFECLPLLDMSQITPSQEIIFWIITICYPREENGESRVGISKAAHQQHNIPTPLISKQSMHHGVVATALNAIKNKCMFVVFYKPRSSQFLVNFDKFVDGVNNKFSIGSRFSMKFEGKDFNEIRYSGTLVGVRDFSTHWNDS